MSLNKIKTIKLKISTNQKGDILKYLTRKNKHLKKFGEIYFTEIKKNKIKGWNLHKKCWCLLAVPYGKVKFIVVPPRIWFSFISLAKFSLVVNTLNEIHKKNESLKIPIN